MSRDLPGRKRSGKTNGNSGHEDDYEPMDEWNEQQQPDLEGPIVSPSIKVIFSPRKTVDMLQWYADRMGDAASSVHYTAAFGVSQPIAEILSQGQNSKGKPKPGDKPRRSPRIARHGKKQEDQSAGDSLLRYVLLDNKPSEHTSESRKEGAEKKGLDYVDYYDFKDVQENRIAFGAILPANGGDSADANVNDGECLTGLTTFVDFIHDKFMIVDALTDNPLVITGSANFSVASTDKVSWTACILTSFHMISKYLYSPSFPRPKIMIMVER